MYLGQTATRQQLFGFERGGIECVIPTLVGHMIVELINQHLYSLCMKLHSRSCSQQQLCRYICGQYNHEQPQSHLLCCAVYVVYVVNQMNILLLERSNVRVKHVLHYVEARGWLVVSNKVSQSSTRQTIYTLTIHWLLVLIFFCSSSFLRVSSAR